MDMPVFGEGPVLPNICLSKTCVSNARELPRGMLMHSPRGRDKITNAECTTPGTDNVSHKVARGGGWVPLELIDALIYP